MSAPRRRARRRSRPRKDVRQNLKRLNTVFDEPAYEVSWEEIERDAGLRFVVRPGEDMSATQIKAEIRASHGLACDVAPLFAEPDGTVAAGDLGGYYLVTVPDVSRADIEGNVFDLSYELLDVTAGGAFEMVEPDLPHLVYEGVPEIPFRLPACSVPDDNAPVDSYWHLRNIRVPAAWQRTPPDGGARFGSGIVIGHPDTGWAEHIELDQNALDLTRAWNFVEKNSDARDPLERSSFGRPRLPGHGTSTGSVIVSRGRTDLSPAGGGPMQQDRLTGVAPQARLVPIRAMRFLPLVYDANIAAAIYYAVERGCHVISMSLGGVGSFALQRAVNYAVSRNVIVCAASGNCVKVVVAPALYRNCIAVAGSNQHDIPWPHGSRGSAVDVTAPGEHVWRALREPDDDDNTVRVAPSQGTSYAVACLSGVAALWLAFHGRDRLLDRYAESGAPLQNVFRQIVKSTARRPTGGWDASRYGPGIVDADAVLGAPLPSPSVVETEATPDDLELAPYNDVIATAFSDAPRETVNRELAALLHVNPWLAPEQLEAQLAAETQRWGPEMLHLLVENRAAQIQFEAALLNAELRPVDLDAESDPTEDTSGSIRMGRAMRERTSAELELWASDALRNKLQS